MYERCQHEPEIRKEPSDVLSLPRNASSIPFIVIVWNEGAERMLCSITRLSICSALGIVGICSLILCLRPWCRDLFKLGKVV